MGAVKKRIKQKVTAKTVKAEALDYTEDFEDSDSSEYILDEITGRKRKSSPMHILNKKKVNKFEMDELFAGDQW